MRLIRLDESHLTGNTPVKRDAGLMDTTNNVRELRPLQPVADAAEACFGQMLNGWRNQMLARNLAFSTIESRLRLARRFAEDLNEYPWTWSPAMFDEWLGDRRAIRGHSRATVRAAALDVRMFCAYLVDPAYGWQAHCEERFGTFPIQVVNEANSATHVQDSEAERSVRPFTLEELQRFFDAADSHVEQIRRNGRKGWVAAFRDATLFKVAYGWGLRRNEVRLVELTDFGSNPAAPEFGRRGTLRVRFGKAMKGSAPKQRTVLTVFGWTVDCVDEWVHEVWPIVSRVGAGTLWPTERAGVVDSSRLGRHFRQICRDAELEDVLTMHSLRRSCVTHLIEEGFDARFVQGQVGHEYASTTALYTGVSSDYRTASLRRSLDRLTDGLLNIGTEGTET